MWSAVPLLIALTTFGTYVTIAGRVLDVASALTALALFEILRFPLFMLPFTINMIVEAFVSVGRIQDFLTASDYIPPPILSSSAATNGTNLAEPIIELKDATFTYQDLNKSSLKKKDPSLQDKLEEADQELLLVKAKLADAEEKLAELEGRPHHIERYGSTGSSFSFNDDDDDEAKTSVDRSEKILSLRRINFECYEGEFVAVVGGVGSGKSTLLKAILGECQKLSGDIGVRGKVAYFDQKPFIMNDTVKGNILFGKNEEKVDEDLYQLAVRSSCLEHDLEVLSSGDLTEIGEKGITLR
jgi:ATP-binding cassette subfamily C (CFTR/MRP) protein 1